MRRVLYSLWRDRWTKPEVDELLEEIGLTGLVRAEAMNVEEHIALAAALRRRLGPGTEIEAEPDPEDDAAGETILGNLPLTFDRGVGLLLRISIKTRVQYRD